MNDFENLKQDLLSVTKIIQDNRKDAPDAVREVMD